MFLDDEDAAILLGYKKNLKRLTELEACGEPVSQAVFLAALDDNVEDDEDEYEDEYDDDLETVERTLRMIANHRTALLFGHVFQKLASDPTPQHVTWAGDFWKMYEAGGYDFGPEDMDADEAMMALGLLRFRLDEHDPDLKTPDYGPHRILAVDD